MIDYAELIVSTRARSLRIEAALRNQLWAIAAALQQEQRKDEACLYYWIEAKQRAVA